VDIQSSLSTQIHRESIHPHRAETADSRLDIFQWNAEFLCGYALCINTPLHTMRAILKVEASRGCAELMWCGQGVEFLTEDEQQWFVVIAVVSSAIHPSIQWARPTVNCCSTDATGVNTNSVTVQKNNKKAELYRRRPHDAPNIWVPRKIWRVLTSPRLLFPKFVTGVCTDRY